MTNAKQILVGLSLAAAMGAVNATPPKTEPCKTGCGGGTTTPVAGGQTTNVDVANNIGVENNIKVPVTVTGTVTGSNELNLHPGAIAPVANGGSVGNVTNGANTLENKNTMIGGTQSLTIKNPKLVPAPTAPAIIGGAGVGVVGGGSIIERSAIEACANMPKGGASWSAAVTTSVVGVSGGRSAGVQGIEKVWEDKVIVGEDGVERTVRVDGECLAGFREEQRRLQVRQAGPAGLAAATVTSISESPALQTGVKIVAPYASCDGDLVTNSILGICPKEPKPVTENAKNFGFAAQGVPQQQVVPANATPCPPGQRRDPVTFVCKHG